MIEGAFAPGVHRARGHTTVPSTTQRTRATATRKHLPKQGVRVGDAERPVDPYLDLGLVAIELDELQFEALSLSDPKFDLNGSANTSARSTMAICDATRTSERRHGRACLASGTLPCEFGGAEPPLQNFLLWAFAASRPRIDPLFKSK